MLRRIGFLALLMLTLSILVAACGDTPTSAPATTAATSATTAATSATTAATSATTAAATSATTAAAATGATGPVPALASGFPNKAINLFVPANPGGGWDQTARLMQQVIQTDKIVSVPIEVTNKGGAGGTIGLAELVTKSKGEQHLMMPMGKVMVGSILTNKSAVTLKDTVPLARLTSEYEVIAVPANSKYKTLQELIADFKKDPKTISWGGGSAGGTDHIVVGLLAKAAGVDPANINYVAFAGGGEAVAAILGGQVTVGVSGFGEWKQYVDGGKMRFLAVSSSQKLPGDSTPTIKDAGLDVVVDNWRGVVGAPGMSKEVQTYYIEVLTRMRNSPVWQDALKKNLWTDTFQTGEEFGKYIEEENRVYGDILKAIGLLK